MEYGSVKSAILTRQSDVASIMCQLVIVLGVLMVCMCLCAHVYSILYDV